MAGRVVRGRGRTDRPTGDKVVRRRMRVVGAVLIALGLLGAGGVALRAASMIGGMYSGVADDPLGPTLDDPQAEGDRVLGVVWWGVGPVALLALGTAVWTLGKSGPQSDWSAAGRL